MPFIKFNIKTKRLRNTMGRNGWKPAKYVRGELFAFSPFPRCRRLGIIWLFRVSRQLFKSTSTSILATFTVAFQFEQLVKINHIFYVIYNSLMFLSEIAFVQLSQSQAQLIDMLTAF